MPLYEYQCRDCGETYESLARTALAPAAPCPACGSARVEKLLSTFSAPSPGARDPGSACTGPSCSLPSGGCCGGGACNLN